MMELHTGVMSYHHDSESDTVTGAFGLEREDVSEVYKKVMRRVLEQAEPSASATVVRLLEEGEITLDHLLTIVTLDIIGSYRDFQHKSAVDLVKRLFEGEVVDG